MSKLDDIRAELAVVTPGGWRSVSTPYHWELQECRSNVTIVRVQRGHGTPPPEPHAALIARAPTYLAALLEVAEAHKELFEFLEVEHWCNACEAKQEHDQGEYCPLTQRLIASRNAHAALEATP